jgi:hypothetical protein
MRRIHLSIFLLILALTVPGCTMPAPTCPTAELVAPVLLSPADGATFDDAFENLTWDYPLDCSPESYRVDLSTDPTFADTSLSGATGSPATSWGPGSPLADCETYYWRVAGGNGFTLGPFSASRSFEKNVSGECNMPASASVSGIVWDDHCVVPDGPLPDPLPAGCVSNGSGGARADGVRAPAEPGIPGVQVDLHWGGCATIPVASVNTDPDGLYTFDGLLAFGSYCVAIRPLNPPNDSILIPGEWTYPSSLSGSDAFANATVDSGTILSDKDFGWDYQLDGVSSMPASASVSGIVWDDQCVVPDGPLPEPLPAGCVSDGEGGARADGIRQPSELGIPGVQVGLHWGGCATIPVANVITDPDGLYTFDGLLTFGSYCVAVRSLNPPNDSILIPGEWTYPSGLTGADAFANASLDSGTILNEKDFGWDYQFGGLSPTPVAASAPEFVFDRQAFCRSGPSQVYRDVTGMLSGEVVEILGMNEDSGLWYFVNWKKFNTKCWVSASTGHTIGDLTGLPVLVAPPTPVPTPVPFQPNATKTPVKK